jgi:hypothetical protein
VYLSNGDGTLTYVPYNSGGPRANGFTGDVSDTHDVAVALDINGDGKADFLWYRPGGGYAGVYISNGDGSVKYIPYCDGGARANGFTGDVSDIHDTAVALDINGDGKSDFLWFRPGGEYAGVYLSSGDGTLKYVAYNTGGARANGFIGDVSDTRDTAVALDINGDGKTDFLWYRPGGGYAGVYISNGDGSLRYVSYSNNSTPANGFTGDVADSHDTAVALDINGDGKTDFLWYRPGGGYAGVYLADPAGSAQLTYVPYSTPSGQTNGFGGDLKSTADTAVALHLTGKKPSDFLWLRPGGGSAAACLSNGNGKVQFVSYEGGTSTWMSDLWDQISKVPVKGIAMPGTHDSSTYNIPSGDIAKNQSVDYTGQLNAGARWFDMRVGYLTYSSPGFAYFPDGSLAACDAGIAPWDSDFYMYGHYTVCTNVKVADVLDQVRQFLDTHPKEIVILAMSTYISNSANNRSSDFEQLVENHLKTPTNGSYIYGNNASYCEGQKPCAGQTLPQDVTPEMLVNANTRVIIVSIGGDAPKIDSLWLQGEINAGYNGDTNGISGDPAYEISFMQSGLNTARPQWQVMSTPTMLLDLQGQLTPDSLNLGGGGCGAYCGFNPIALAGWFNPTLKATLESGAWSANELNIISVDDIVCCGIADAIINANQQQWNVIGPVDPANPYLDVAAGKDGSIWRVLQDNSIAYWTGTQWIPAQGASGSRIAVDPNGLPWVIDPSGSIWRLQASTLASFQAGTGVDKWDLMPGRASDIGIGGDGSVWVVGNASADSLYKFNGSSWDLLPSGAGPRVAVDNSGAPWVIGTDNRGVWRYNGQSWTVLPQGDFTTVTDLGIGAEGSVWITGTDAQSAPGVWRWNTANGWQRYRGSGIAVSVDGSGSPLVANGSSYLFMGKIN